MADPEGAGPGQAKLEDSNMANYGSDEHRDLRKQAAQTGLDLCHRFFFCSFGPYSPPLASPLSLPFVGWIQSHPVNPLLLASSFCPWFDAEVAFEGILIILFQSLFFWI